MTREEAIDVLKHNYPSACFEDLCEAVDVAIQALSIQPERKKGKWISKYTGKPVEVINGVPKESCECSVCGKWLVASNEYYVNGNFCPYCGADMRGDSDD